MTFEFRLIGMWGSIALCCALLISACGSNTIPEQGTKAVPPTIRLARVGTAPDKASIERVGSIAFRRETKLSFLSPGRILRVNVNEGQNVRKGQILATLDTGSLAADLGRAKAEFDRAASEFERSKKLAGGGWITRTQYENALSKLKISESQLKAATFQYSAATIVAPQDGVILLRSVERGQIVGSGTPVVVIGEATSGFVMRVNLTDREISQVVLGSNAQVRLQAISSDLLTGRIIEIGGQADPFTGTYLVEIGLPDHPGLKSGLIGSAHIPTSSRQSRILSVPSTAMFSVRAGEGFVYVFKPETHCVALRKVTIGELSDGSVGVTAGVEVGEMVAVSRLDLLADGRAVNALFEQH
jgi:RND family efflux transporter MFP subunit